MSIEGRSFFIISCARSGSTSLSRILDAAENATCAMEPTPNLNVETRKMMDGRLADPEHVLNTTVIRRVKEGLARTDIYGEKNLTYGPFITHLYEMLKCRFVFLKRDGRDVVRSLMDWHAEAFGEIYRECRDPGRLSRRALAAASRLPVHLDSSDYLRPRPLPGEPFHDEWDAFSREEMCAYYWARINNLYLDELSGISDGSWSTIDYTNPSAKDIFDVAQFLGLTGLSEDVVGNMLGKRINSLQDRFSEARSFPGWKDWDGRARRRFDRMAAGCMERLGYYSDKRTRWRPEGFGRTWNEKSGDLEWYTWMYNSRLKMHRDLVKWVTDQESAGERIETIADLGCGLGVGYCEDFADKCYVGIDISRKNIEWCRQNRSNARHRYVSADPVCDDLGGSYNVVFSSGTIDNSYDIEEFLRAMVRLSNRWIYLTCYRGWFPELEEHRYSWNEEHGCFYNDVSPSRVRTLLLELGCRDVRVEAVKSGNKETTHETLIVARVPDHNTGRDAT